ncbi:small-subunit processome [Lineolata rhizophorae]|uniref:U3 small nucleolar RNA-associated protein 11 n=1 Tax=Lineolata rhizophorae TaxID=578093 RepID=A0A6A6P248_9PEZI|nr:small-subunit processome [Lineolata rhizophorae]
MSSMRNAVQRRNHRERAQPLERQKWGILEKHKDYALRAKDHKAKATKLKALRQKAADRNPDEFHFAMMSARTGAHGERLADRGNKALSEDVVRLLKTQDAGYIRTMLQRARREREKLEEGFMVEEKGEGVMGLKGVGGGKKKGKHTVFVGDVEEQKGFRPEEWFGTDKEGLSRSWNRPRRQQEDEIDEEDDDEDVAVAPQQQKSRKAIEAEYQQMKEERAMRKKLARERVGRLHRLQALRDQERQLEIAEQELEKQRARMSNSIGGVNKNGVKFKIRERKR